MSAVGNGHRVVITGVGVVSSCLRGGSAALGAYLASPRSHPGALSASTLAEAVDGLDVRRLSRVCQLAMAASRLAVSDAGSPADEGLGLVLGTEFGDLRSTHEFAGGYLARGQAGLSPLLFPNTVMNTMAAATTITLRARGLSLTINAPTISGELAIARAAACVAAGRAERLLAGGVDEVAPFVGEMLGQMDVDLGARGEGAAFVVLETWESACARQVRVLGEILAAASGALPARPHGVGRSDRSPLVARALAKARLSGGDVGWVYNSANGDPARDSWERSLLDRALAPNRPPTTSLSLLAGHHAGMGAMRVAAAAWTARAGLLPLVTSRFPSSTVEVVRVPAMPGLVHGVARGGNQAALIVGPPPAT